MDIIKNPVFIGIVFGGLSYLYLRWKNNNDTVAGSGSGSGSKNRKPKDVNLLIPLVITIITWFLVYGYMHYNKTISISDINIKTNLANNSAVPIPIPPNSNFVFKKEHLTSSNSDNTFSLLNGGGNINIPNKLPNVMIDLF